MPKSKRPSARVHYYQFQMPGSEGRTLCVEERKLNGDTRYAYLQQQGKQQVYVDFDNFSHVANAAVSTKGTIRKLENVTDFADMLQKIRDYSSPEVSVDQDPAPSVASSTSSSGSVSPPPEEDGSDAGLELLAEEIADEDSLASSVDSAADAHAAAAAAAAQAAELARAQEELQRRQAQQPQAKNFWFMLRPAPGSSAAEKKFVHLVGTESGQIFYYAGPENRGPEITAQNFNDLFSHKGDAFPVKFGVNFNLVIQEVSFRQVQAKVKHAFSVSTEDTEVNYFIRIGVNQVISMRTINHYDALQGLNYRHQYLQAGEWKYCDFRAPNSRIPADADKDSYDQSQQLLCYEQAAGEDLKSFASRIELDLADPVKHSQYFIWFAGQPDMYIQLFLEKTHEDEYAIFYFDASKNKVQLDCQHAYELMLRNAVRIQVVDGSPLSEKVFSVGTVSNFSKLIIAFQTGTHDNGFQLVPSNSEIYTKPDSAYDEAGYLTNVRRDGDCFYHSLAMNLLLNARGGIDSEQSQAKDVLARCDFEYSDSNCAQIIAAPAGDEKWDLLINKLRKFAANLTLSALKSDPVDGELQAQVIANVRKDYEFILRRGIDNYTENTSHYECAFSRVAAFRKFFQAQIAKPESERVTAENVADEFLTSDSKVVAFEEYAALIANPSAKFWVDELVIAVLRSQIRVLHVPQTFSSGQSLESWLCLVNTPSHYYPMGRYSILKQAGSSYKFSQTEIHQRAHSPHDESFDARVAQFASSGHLPTPLSDAATVQQYKQIVVAVPNASMQKLLVVIHDSNEQSRKFYYKAGSNYYELTQQSFAHFIALGDALAQVEDINDAAQANQESFNAVISALNDHCMNKARAEAEAAAQRAAQEAEQRRIAKLSVFYVQLTSSGQCIEVRVEFLKNENARKYYYKKTDGNYELVREDNTNLLPGHELESGIDGGEFLIIDGTKAVEEPLAVFDQRAQAEFAKVENNSYQIKLADDQYIHLRIVSSSGSDQSQFEYIKADGTWQPLTNESAFTKMLGQGDPALKAKIFTELQGAKFTPCVVSSKSLSATIIEFHRMGALPADIKIVNNPVSSSASRPDWIGGSRPPSPSISQPGAGGGPIPEGDEDESDDEDDEQKSESGNAGGQGQAPKPHDSAGLEIEGSTTKASFAPLTLDQFIETLRVYQQLKPQDGAALKTPAALQIEEFTYQIPAEGNKAASSEAPTKVEVKVDAADKKNSNLTLHYGPEKDGDKVVITHTAAHTADPAKVVNGLHLQYVQGDAQKKTGDEKLKAQYLRLAHATAKMLQRAQPNKKLDLVVTIKNLKHVQHRALIISALHQEGIRIVRFKPAENELKAEKEKAKTNPLITVSDDGWVEYKNSKSELSASASAGGPALFAPPADAPSAGAVPGQSNAAGAGADSSASTASDAEFGAPGARGAGLPQHDTMVDYGIASGASGLRP